jgi:alpha-N-acetylglucosamine transferase
LLETKTPSQRKVPFKKQRRAVVSSLHNEAYYPLALAMGYSLTQTNDLVKQNAEMVLFVREQANISTMALDKLRRIGWKLRIEDDLEFKDVDIEQIRYWHRWNLNKLRFWSWIEYDQILFIDSDALVKGDLSEIWSTPGSSP